MNGDLQRVNVIFGYGVSSAGTLFTVVTFDLRRALLGYGFKRGVVEITLVVFFNILYYVLFSSVPINAPCALSTLVIVLVL